MVSSSRPLVPLPIDGVLAEIRAAVDRHRAVVVTAAPGAGKTTRVPPALVDGGPVLVLQPRRVAARAIARRIADEQGWTVGREVGWHVRFDRRVCAETRLTVATEGILTARLQADPLLSDLRTVILDEFHERSVHADLGLALARQAWLARPDLRLVVMSATMDPEPVAAYLGGCPVVAAPERIHPVDVRYAPEGRMETEAVALGRAHRGAVLCFLSGVREITDAQQALSGCGVPVFPLHGQLELSAQEAALQPGRGARIVLATNIAETTITVPDVVAVVDSGWQKVARYDPARGVDALVRERVSEDSANQRAGRAGRTQAGRVVRLWDARDRLRPTREPEIRRVDLAAPALDVLAWGDDPRQFPWFEAPAPWALDAAIELLRRLDAVGADGRVTRMGRALQQVPLHPRLARVLIEAGASPQAALVCAWLSDGGRVPWPAPGVSGDSDLEALSDVTTPEVVRVAAAQLRERGRAAVEALPQPPPSAEDGVSLRRAVFAGYRDRLARRREAGQARCVLASGTGAVVARESVVTGAEWFVALEVAAQVGGVGRPAHTGAAAVEALVRRASAVDEDWLVPTRTEVVHWFDAGAGVVRAARREWVDAILMREVGISPSEDEEATCLADAWLARANDDARTAVERRLAFAGIAVDWPGVARAAAAGRTRLDQVNVEDGLPSDVRAALARLAPVRLSVPSGREAPLTYRVDGAVVASVKLQEVFGLSESPRLGPRQVPVTFELLAPNQRPVQVTQDLRSFWTRGYPEVRRLLRARYPKHPWPDDPWTAVPTHRTRR
jgi:ATP-dependent helicase HrpB